MVGFGVWGKHNFLMVLEELRSLCFKVVFSWSLAVRILQRDYEMDVQEDEEKRNQKFGFVSLDCFFGVRF